MYNGNIDILVGEAGATITIRDEISNETIAHVELSPQDFCLALSRRVYVPCDVKTGYLDRVGKKMIMDELNFVMPPDIPYKDRQKVAITEAAKVCPEGWVPDTYYGSQKSFFRGADGQEYARTIIRRWVTEGDEETNTAIAEWRDACNQN